MRTPMAVLFFLTLLVAGTYFYQSAQAICAVPIAYRIGTIDDRFGLSSDEVRVAVADAEAAWEDATERNLFTYDDTAKLSVNFIYDDRQAFASAEENFKDRLDVTEDVSESLKKTYAELVARYKEADVTYKTAAAEYERRLNRYNDTVQQYNDAGGAPSGEYEALEAEKSWLAHQRTVLTAQADELNDLVGQINDIGNRGNQLIDTYNRNVETFNEQFGEAREFTQGDYTGKSINIYTFKSAEELRLVLAHEMGHALSLDHASVESAVMYHHLGGQSGYLPTDADLTLFQSVCGASTLTRMKQRVAELVHAL